MSRTRRCGGASLDALGKMGIPPTRFRQYPHEFSGGMRQRIMIALALVLRPKLLIADEPTTALDVIVEAQILAILADLKENFGTALLLITHNLGIIAEACDRVAVMYAGQIVEEGDARDVFAEPAHPYTRELLRSTISLDTTRAPLDPGRAAEPRRAAAGVPLPSALPERDAGVSGEAARSSSGSTDGRRVLCWLHGPEQEIPPGGDGAAPAGGDRGCRRSLSRSSTTASTARSRSCRCGT